MNSTSLLAPEFISTMFMQLLPQLPLLAVWAVGFIIALRRWREHPTVSLLVSIAMVLAACVTLGATPLYMIVPRMMSGNGRSMQEVFMIIGVLHSLLIAAAFGLLLYAVFFGRPRADAVR